MTEFLNGIRSADIQQQIVDLFKSYEIGDESTKICGNDVPTTDEVRKALADICAVEPADSQVPLYNAAELQDPVHFDESEKVCMLLTIVKLEDLLHLESLAWVVFQTQLARYSPEQAPDALVKSVPFATLFDNIQVFNITCTPVEEPAALDCQIEFYWTGRYSENLKREAEHVKSSRPMSSVKEEDEEPIEPEENLLDYVRRMVYERDNTEQISNIARYAEEAEAPYRTLSMKDVAASGTYTGPPKYLRQRDQPMEVPMECVRRLCDAIDTSFDDRCALWEIQDYVNKKQLPFEEGIIEKMFEEAI